MKLFQDSRRLEAGAWLSICVYATLTATKICIGYVYQSTALMADGWNNGTDILASCAVLIGIRIANKPADSNHKYGHSRAETIASLIASFLMVMVGVQVVIDALTKLYEGNHPDPDIRAAYLSLGSAAILYILYRINLYVANKAGSLALKSMAFDNRSDMYVSFGATIGIVASIVGITWLDTVTAFIVGILICKTGWNIFKEASHMLSDGFNEHDLNLFRDTVSKIEGVEYVKDIKGRFLGNRIFVDLIIEVNQELNVVESHSITEKVEEELTSKHKVEYVHVHIEPCQHVITAKAR